MMLLAATAMSTACASAAESAICANSEQTAKVLDGYKAMPGAFPSMMNQRHGVTKAQVVSALPADQSIGVTNAQFAEIWETLTKWDHAVAAVISSGQVLEIHGVIQKGALSTRSKNFNLAAEGGGMSGHLRPDLMSAIFAISIPGKEKSRTRGVMFMDENGKSAFGVFMPEEAGPLTAAQVAQFDVT